MAPTLWELAIKLIVETGLNCGEAPSQCLPSGLSQRKPGSLMVNGEEIQCAGGTGTSFHQVFVVAIKFSKAVNSQIPDLCPPPPPIAFPVPPFSEVTNYHTVIGIYPPR